MSEVILNASNFDQEVLNSDIPVVVDFWAEWCGPCKMLGPVVAQVADELAGKVKVCKLNVDDNQDLAAKYGIMSIPAVFKFESGNVTARSIGYVNKETLLSNLSIQ